MIHARTFPYQSINLKWNMSPKCESVYESILWFLHSPIFKFPRLNESEIESLELQFPREFVILITMFNLCNLHLYLHIIMNYFSCMSSPSINIYSSDSLWMWKLTQIK